MKDSQVLNDLDNTPDETSAHHPRERLHGKHRDFSASRLQARERARQRVQQAIEDERERARERAEMRRPSASKPDLEDLPDPPLQAAQPDIQEPLPPHADGLQASVPPPAVCRQILGQQAVSAAAPEAAPQVAAVISAPPALNPQSSPARDAAAPRTRHSFEPSETQNPPAWLRNRPEAAPNPARRSPLDTLQDTRGRLASRWFALKGMLQDAAASSETLPAPAASPVSNAPVMAVFSLAGGVGKSSLAATLGRALSSRGERVLLVETTAYGLLPFFFGARERRSGTLRTFAPPEPGSDAPVQTLAIDGDSLPPASDTLDPLSAEIAAHTGSAGRVIVDVATASAAAARHLLRLSPMVLVPLVADMNSVVNAGSVESFFQRNSETPGKFLEVYYVLNQFDPSLPLHLDVREVLRERLGDRLLPFALRRSPAISEALAEGMTVLDYAPDSPIAEDFNSLAAWVKARSAPAGAARRRMRWLEQ